MSIRDALIALKSNIPGPWNEAAIERRISAGVRSISPDIKRPARRRQSRPLFISQLYEFYTWNYATRACVDAIKNDGSKNGHIWEPVKGVTVTPAQEGIRDQCERLLTDPNPEMTESDLIAAMLQELLLVADSYNEVAYSNLTDKVTREIIGRTPSELWPISSPTMWILPKDETGRLPKPPLTAYQQLKSDGSTVDFTADEILHISEGNLTGRLYGNPRLLSVLILVATQHQGILHNLNTFAGERVPKAMVGVGNVSDEDLERLIHEAEKQAYENPQGVMFLASQALSYLKLIESNRDMEFMELMKFVERCVCAIYRVPPVAIGISEAGGAGIIVGRSQTSKYWDNIEGLLREIQERFNKFFRERYGLIAFKLRLLSGRPEINLEEAQIEDLRIKNGSLTVNEVRERRGLKPVPWGDEPPMAAAPLALSHDPDQPGFTSAGYTLWPGRVQKADTAPGRMHESALADDVAERIKKRTRSRIGGSWLRARADMLKILDEWDVITKADEQITTVEQLQAELDKVLEKWEAEAVGIMADGNADAYADSRIGMIQDLEVEGEVVQFGTVDEDRLRAIHDEFAVRPIRTYRGEQRKIIEDAVAAAYASDAVSTTEIRAQIEESFQAFAREETWKLDRIVRTSVHNANTQARVQALEDSGIQEGRLLTKRDGRVRDEHRRYHNKVISLDLARDILSDINCRCRFVKAVKQPKGVPSPEQLAAAIAENGGPARQRAREVLGAS